MQKNRKTNSLQGIEWGVLFAVFSLSVYEIFDVTWILASVAGFLISSLLVWFVKRIIPRR